MSPICTNGISCRAVAASCGRRLTGAAASCRMSFPGISSGNFRTASNGRERAIQAHGSRFRPAFAFMDRFGEEKVRAHNHALVREGMALLARHGRCGSIRPIP